MCRHEMFGVRYGLLGRVILPMLLCSAVTNTVEAQSDAHARYRFGRDDTLHYAERTTARAIMRAPAGEIVVQTVHDAGIAILGVGDGIVDGWFERLVLQQLGPGAAERTPETSALLGSPYRLALTALGQVQTQSMPAFPAPITAMADLSREFDDFFIALPSVALQRGVTWADTVVRTRGPRPDSSTTTRHLRTYRVERDTTIAGARAAVISLHQLVRLESAAPMTGRPLRTRMVLEGEEHGTAVFVFSIGRLHSRERRGAMSGTLTISGGPQAATLPQSYEYTSTLMLQPSSR
jgi:hypothetical protein